MWQYCNVVCESVVLYGTSYHRSLQKNAGLPQKRSCVIRYKTTTSIRQTINIGPEKFSIIT